MRYLQLGTSLSNMDIADKKLKDKAETESSQANSGHGSPLKLNEADHDAKASDHQFFKNNMQTYSHHLSQINELTVGDKVAPQDIQQLNSPQSIMNELSPFQSTYACIDQQQFAVYLLTITKSNQCDMMTI